MMKLDTKCALTCIVPAINEIQNIRKEYDTAYERWMPHFNIGCFPFYSADSNPEILPRIQSICKKYDQMTITLDELQRFPVSKKTPGTAYANVSEKSGALVALYNDLSTAFNFSTSKKFVPHVTLGRFNDQVQMDKVCESIDWKPFVFTLCGLDLIQRTDAHTPFVIVYHFPFGSDSYNAIQSSVSDNIISEAEVNSDYTATMSNFNDYYIYNIQTNVNCKPLIKSRISNFLLIDNSGSMGSNTKSASNIIGKGLINMKSDTIDIVPGEILLFSSRVDKIDKLINSSSIDNLVYPNQGQTNITEAIIVTIDRIVDHSNAYNRDGSIHYILTFLSDGQHNCGVNLTELDIKKLKSIIVVKEIKLSIIVVGIASNDTKLGMRIKTNLETLPIANLKSVYYATSTIEMNSVLSELVRGCSESLCETSCVTIKTSTGIFIDSMTNSTKKLISNGSMLTIKAHTRPTVLIDGKVLKCISEPCCVTDITKVVDSILPKLSQIKIAYGTASIVNQIKTLNNFIETADSFFSALKSDQSNIDDIGKIKLKPSQRAAILKKLRQSQLSFQEERNKLKLLQAQVSNDSHKQAEYLNGFNKKYASKATIKSGTMDVSQADIINQIELIIPKLSEAIKSDAAIASDPPTSMLSLNTPLEHFEEWLNFDKCASTDIYSLLVQLGFSCYPVKFSHNNAVQMDPFQTECIYVEPFMADTPNIMLANQLKLKLTAPSANVYTDGLMLLEPSAPSSFKVLMRTHIYQYICSVILCRDLYMYNHNMTFAMHAHALVKAISNFYETGSKAYVELALKIIYSFKTIGCNSKLFNHWYNEWNTVTQSPEDECNHPVQLLLLLACQSNVSDNWIVPLVNLVNEVLARHMKIKFYNIEDNSQVVSMMQSIFNINEDNSPKPNPDVLVEEPNVEITRESCQQWTDTINTAALEKNFKCATIFDYVDAITLEYVRTFNFVYGLTEIANWEADFVSNRDILLEKICAGNVTNVFEYVGVSEKNINNVANAMFLQSVLYRTSQTRHDINLKNVLDPSTLCDLIVDLRMAKYFELCKSKKEKWLSIIGNVSFQRAHDTDAYGLSQMIGTHTHGFTRDEFWGILEAVVDDNEKLQVFLNASNCTVSNCVDKIKSKRH
jgi:2'-5' RNA ligase